RPDAVKAPPQEEPKGRIETTFPRRPPRPANFRPDVVEKAKKSAVMLLCLSADSGGWGSGWVAEKNGQERYIVTNAHVVLMKELAKPPPEQIKVYFNVGTPDQRILEGKLIALDRDEDLAVVRVKGPDLPEPLPIAPSYDL